MNHENNDIIFSPVDFDPFAGPEIIKAAPATEPQIEVWLACKLGGDDANRSYNESVSLELKGELDINAMKAALQMLVSRHEALRSIFSADGKQILICKEAPVNLVYLDISDKDPLQCDKFISDYSTQDALSAFDLSNGPLFRLALFKREQLRYILILTLHHIIADGWSIGVILQELSILYNAYLNATTPQLQDAPLFTRYADEQRIFATTSEYKKIEQYWLDQYKNTVPVLSLPTDYPRPLNKTYKSQRDDYTIDSHVIAEIKKAGAQAGSSFVTTLVVAFELFLQKLTGQEDVVVGLPAAGQSATGNYGLVGHCVNLLPLRSNYQGALTFLEYLKKRKSQIFDDYEHQQITFGSLLKKLNIPRDTSRVALVPVVFNIDLGMDKGVAFDNISHKLIYNPRQYENFEIFLNVSGSEQSIVFEWSYNTQIFKPESIRKMMTDFEALLKVIIARPELKIGDIPFNSYISSDAINALTDTASDYPKDIPLPVLLSKVVSHYPDNVAVVFDNVNYSYKQINEKANQLATLLLINGIKTGSTVALVLDRSVEMIIAMLAIMKAGAAYLPIDPEYPKNRVEYMLKDSGTKLLLTAKKYEKIFTSDAIQLLVEEAWVKLPRYTTEDIEVKATGRDLAYVIYTSGSTGNPKGVQVEHHSIVNLLVYMQKTLGIVPGDKLLAATTVSFDIAALELFLPLFNGATVYLAGNEASKDARLLLDIARKEQITIMQATPSMWSMMLEAGWNDKLPMQILSGGEALSKELADKLAVRCNVLWNLYGPTETTVWSTIKQIQQGDSQVTIGKPIANTQVYLLGDNMQLLPPGAAGNIFIGGDGVSRGYINNAELNAEKFITNSFVENGGFLYKTGDLGKLTYNGDIQYLGRGDYQVKLRGHRIELEEIEQTLLSQEGVKQAVVIVKDTRLIAYVVPDEGVSEAMLPAWKKGLRDILPQYMFPNDYVVVQKLPLTPNAKVDRNALSAMLQDAVSTGEYVAPRNELEQIIADIWMGLLEVEKLSVYDDFFELGGHSLLAIQAMTRLEKRTGKRLPVASLFDAPTVEKLAQWAEMEGKAITLDSLVPLKASGNKTPLYIVHGYDMNVLSFTAVAKHMDQDQPVFGLQPKGLNDTDTPFKKMEEIAAEYIEEILEQNPSGAYALAGYSFGGYIAYEMAQQLKAMGKTVKMLAMFDAYAYSEKDIDPASDKLKKKIARQVPKALFILNSFVKQPLETIGYQSHITKEKLKNLFGGKEEGLSTTESKVFERYEYAYSHYTLKPYDGIIDLFRVQKRLYFLDDMKYLGWRPYALKGMRVHEIPGDHKTFIMVPNNKDFAKILQNALDFVKA